MIRVLAALAPIALALAGCGGSGTPGNAPAANLVLPTHSADPPVPADLPDIVPVRIETELGAITVALDHKHAPVTVTNFVRYVDDHRFDGTVFYRASRTPGAPHHGFVQGGIQHSYRLMLPPIRLEPTTETGLLHRDGTISMARSTPDTAMGDFTISIGPNPGLDAHPGRSGDNMGYASFGQVTEGMDVVRRILGEPTVAQEGRGPMAGQKLQRPIRILSIRRLPAP
jgi:peptidyl-prolyl cis-trans isomerase A (cyclophilin A)